MPVPERRQSPRSILERLAYINIEPNNGGIVLNVSDEGLCFHSIAPVVRNGKLRFSLLEHNRRIEADGELVWMDEAQKVGGVRFAGLPAEAREQIQNWISERPMVLDDGDEADGQPEVPSFTLGGFSAPPVGFAAAQAVAASRAQTSSESEKPGFLSGFSGGLALGLLIAALITGGFLLHGYRHLIGESLIAVGQRLSGKPEVQPAQVHPPTPQAVSPSAMPSAPVAKVISEPASDLRPIHEKQPTKPATHASSPESRKTQSAPAADSAIKVLRSERESLPKATVPVVTPPPLALANGPAVPITKLLTDKTGTLPQLKMAERSDVHTQDAGTGTTGTPSRLYFEVGKFKQESWARKATDELAHLGFPTSINQKGRFWGSAYYVLVGPYSDRETADRAHKSLASSGFKPRSFERGSRNFTLSTAVSLNRLKMSGDFVISWESYISDARIKFLQNDLLVTAADARWVERGIRNERNAFVYQRNPDGSRHLLEIRFEGMSKVLVFTGPS